MPNLFFILFLTVLELKNLQAGKTLKRGRTLQILSTPLPWSFFLFM